MWLAAFVNPFYDGEGLVESTLSVAFVRCRAVVLPRFG